MFFTHLLFAPGPTVLIIYKTHQMQETISPCELPVEQETRRNKV